MVKGGQKHMNKSPRTAIFKKKIAIEALREDKTIEEIAKEYSLNRVQVSQWKKELLDGAEAIFERKGRKKARQDDHKEALERKIGQLTIEIDWLKKKLGI
jgi:transposase-like protein